ncbi:MAG TPA: sensor histidine kinase, partial [Syntrophorhabdaceae bacterium]
IILNELLTNAMKHAFDGMEEGIIRVALSMIDSHVVFIVEDSGKGISEDVDGLNSEGFGLQLVSMLTEQLEGVLRIERTNGSRFTLEFDL